MGRGELNSPGVSEKVTKTQENEMTILQLIGEKYQQLGLIHQRLLDIFLLLVLYSFSLRSV